MAGLFDLEELSKRRAAIDGELSVLQELRDRTDSTIELDDGLVVEIVDVFSSWRDLTREQKRLEGSGSPRQGLSSMRPPRFARASPISWCATSG